MTALPDLAGLQPLLGSPPISMIVTDPAGVVLSWNDQAETMYGWSAQEATGRQIDELVVRPDGLSGSDALVERLRDGRAWEGEYRVKRSDGREISVHDVVCPLSDDTAEVTGFIGFSVDVTRNRQASGAVLDAVLGNCPTSVTVIDADDRIATTTGGVRTRDDIRSSYLGRTLAEVAPDTPYLDMVKAARGGDDRNSRLVEFNGRTYDATAVLLPESVVGAGGVAVVATDITERLTDARRFQALVETMEEVTSIIEADGSVRYLSPAIEKLTGYPVAAAMAMTGETSILHPDDAAASSAAFRAVCERAGAVVTQRYRLLHSDGEWRDIEQTMVNRLDDPAIHGLVATGRDVTERVAAEAQLRAANEQLRGVNRMHSVLSAAGVAMVRADDAARLLADVCQILVTIGEFDAAAFVGPPGAEPALLTGCQARAGSDWTAAMIEAVRAVDVAPTAPDAVPPTGAPNPPSPDVVLFAIEPREAPCSTLAICCKAGRALNADNRELLVGMAREIAFALESLAIDDKRTAALVLSRRLAQQQSVVSHLGFMALGSDELVSLFDAAVAAVEPFGQRQVIMYEALAGGDQVLVRAVAGTEVPVDRGGVVLRSMLPVTDRVLVSGRSVHVDDYARDQRFVKPLGSPLFASGSGVSVPIRVHGSTVAALTVHSFVENDFDSHDVDFYHSVANVISGAMERNRYESTVRHDAMHDRLTGLPNRVLFHDRLTQAIARCRRRQSNPLAVIVADLDAFKGVNDQHGHEAGDSLLALVGARLREAVRPSDTVARLGGDEYVILCEELISASEAATVATRITERIREPFFVDGHEVHVTISAGVAVGSAGASAEGLLRDADGAMYRAKETGRDRAELYDDELRARLVHRADLERGLRTALESGEFIVAYQPILDVSSGAVREAEALLRWTRPDGTVVSPAEFIPIAEETGMIVAIGAWVLARACEDAVRWNQRFAPADQVGVGVNLSARQIGDPCIVPTVVSALETTGLAPCLLRLEITETALMEDAGAATATLQSLDRLGVQLSVDDFGTGYSSLMYLRRFPVRILKVDRYFVAGLGKNSEDEAIVQAVIALAHSLGLSATAEGVETAEQLGRLRTLECDSAQGFLWSKAQPFDDFIRVVEAIRGEVAPAVPPPVARVAVVASVRDQLAPRFRAALVDDSAAERGLLRVALEDSGEFEVVGEADDGLSAIALAARTRPDVLVLDMSMTGMSGLEAMGRITEAAPETRIVFLSGFLSGTLSEAVERAGAFAQFDKSVPLDDLVKQLIARLRDSSVAKGVPVGVT
jgi:diguanylate cyclase (GGDEF)-like protein/PAS domain S-box-containing protein